MPHNPLLAIPVFNEERHLDRVLQAAAQHISEILVIDDGSTDQTADRLRNHSEIHLITHAENRGYGKSLSDAFEFAISRGYSWLVTMDCDEQHEPG
jgi:dolichol-phosphate mannosyltransferase